MLAIIAAGWFAVAELGAPALLALVLLLAGQLVWFARAEARRVNRGGDVAEQAAIRVRG